MTPAIALAGDAAVDQAGAVGPTTGTPVDQAGAVGPTTGTPVDQAGAVGPTTGTPVDQAIRLGAASASVGEAFLAGYRAALAHLVPSLPAGCKACLCASEDGGERPSAIRTRLRADGDGWRLDGHKKWAIGAGLAEALLVVASTGVDDTGRNRLRVALVDVRQAGVTLEPMPPTPFVPDIPHAEVSFADVQLAADAVLPGDGYDRYLKPFRTVEDIHVHAAVLAFVAAIADRAGWPRAAQQRLFAILVATRALAPLDPLAPPTHLALAGVLALARAFFDEVRPLWATVDEPTRLGWERDLALLDVAGRARAARTDAAWERWHRV